MYFTDAVLLKCVSQKYYVHMNNIVIETRKQINQAVKSEWNQYSKNNLQMSTTSTFMIFIGLVKNVSFILYKKCHFYITYIYYTNYK